MTDTATPPPQTFSGKVIVVAGASRGTGLAVVKYLLARGASVSMSSSSAANLGRALGELTGEFPLVKDRLLLQVCDVAKLETVEAWMAETVRRFGRIHGCANVAGKEQRRLYPLTTLSLEEWHDIVDVNLNGMFHLLREEMKVIEDGGSIVNVGSVCSRYASAGYGAYIASKHALVGLTKAAAFEGAPRGVRVNAVCPGAIGSDMQSVPFELPDGGTFVSSGETMPQLFRRFAEPEEIAATICFLLGDETKFVTKAEWYIDGGWMESSFTN